MVILKKSTFTKKNCINFFMEYHYILKEQLADKLIIRLGYFTDIFSKVKKVSTSF